MKQILSSAFENEAKAFVGLLLQEVILPKMGFWRKIVNIKKEANAFVGV